MLVVRIFWYVVNEYRKSFEINRWILINSILELVQNMLVDSCSFKSQINGPSAWVSIDLLSFNCIHLEL